MSPDPVLWAPRHINPLRVLVVDDAPDIRALLRAMLSDRADILLLEASGCEEALVVAAAEPPDLAVLDENIPGMDGVTTTRELKALLADLEIVAFTAVLGAERQFAQAGATRHFLQDRFGDLIGFISERGSEQRRAVTHVCAGWPTRSATQPRYRLAALERRPSSPRRRR